MYRNICTYFGKKFLFSKMIMSMYVFFICDKNLSALKLFQITSKLEPGHSQDRARMQPGHSQDTVRIQPG